MKVASIVGARPQFIKAAMVSAAFARAEISESLIHTGQHYDFAMSELFFEQLGLPKPQHSLGVGSASHGAQTGRALEAIEAVLQAESFDCVLVYGDTNSTLAGALAAAKMHVPVAHVEAGLRSFNRRMPEEINRVLTDHVSEMLFVPTEGAVKNLRDEGIDEKKIHVVGDVMYDAALSFASLYRDRSAALLEGENLRGNDYFLATVHRAENTDDETVLRNIIAGMNATSEIAPVLWPLHPRTRARLETLNLQPADAVRLREPIGYFEMQSLLVNARGVLTDSGGLQKEAAFHGVPTSTLRDETEWPETVTCGCNTLTGADTDRIVANAMRCHGAQPELVTRAFGDGHASDKIAQLLLQNFS